jgi:hypothetical protein
MSATARKQPAPAPSPDAAVDPIAALAGQIVELKLDQEAMRRELDELRAMVQPEPASFAPNGYE